MTEENLMSKIAEENQSAETSFGSQNVAEISSSCSAILEQSLVENLSGILDELYQNQARLLRKINEENEAIANSEAVKKVHLTVSFKFFFQFHLILIIFRKYFLIF